MKLKYQFAIQKVCDFWAAVPVGADSRVYHGVISLNETACDMMKFLQQDITEQQLVESMQQEYDAPVESLRSDVHNFVQQLREAEVLSE